MEINHRLIEARKARNLSLEDIHRMTKIKLHFLVAIEEGDFSSIPGDFYVRAFIRSYAEAVGLNPAQILEEHQEEIPSLGKPVNLNLPVAKDKKKSKSSRGFSFSPLAIAIPVLVIVLFAGWVYAVSFYESERNPVENNQAEEEIVFIFPSEESNPETSGSQESSSLSQELGFFGGKEMEKGRQGRATPRLAARFLLN